MTEFDRQKWYSGGCHCGKVRFEVQLTRAEAIRCNCSICRKKGFLHLIVTPDNFHLLQGDEYLTTYTFNTHTAIHKFCRYCGIHPFYTPRSHPDSIDVNVNALDEDIVDSLTITNFNGQNWEENIEQLTIPSDSILE